MSLHPPLAYVGPGPGLTMVWAFIALLGTICLSLLYLLTWPLRRLLRWARGPAADIQAPARVDEGAEQAVGAGAQRE